MEKLIIEKTKNTPGVNFNPNGVLSLEGRIVTEDSGIFFHPLIQWAEKLDCKNVNFKINLDYINTSASKLLFTILRIIDENDMVENFKIIWYYEFDDEDHKEIGEYFKESLCKAVFEYQGVSEVYNAA